MFVESHEDAIQNGKGSNQVDKMKNIEDQTAILLVPSYTTLTLTHPIPLDWMQVYKPQTLIKC